MIYYLLVSIRPFPNTRNDKGYYVFVERMKEGSANVIECRVLESKTKQEAKEKLKAFISNYDKEFSYIRL